MQGMSVDTATALHEDADGPDDHHGPEAGGEHKAP
jgi:hypothetical protein